MLRVNIQSGQEQNECIAFPLYLIKQLRPQISGVKFVWVVF